MFIEHIYTNCKKFKKYQEKKITLELFRKKKQKKNNIIKIVILNSDNESAIINIFNIIIENEKESVKNSYI